MWVAFPKDASSPSMGRLGSAIPGSAHFWKGHPHPGSHTCLQKTSRRHTLRIDGGAATLFCREKRCLSEASCFFPAEKCRRPSELHCTPQHQAAPKTQTTR